MPHIIKLVGSSISLYDLKYHLENILNPLRQVPIVCSIETFDYGIYIVSFNGVSGILQSLYNNLYIETEARLVINNNNYYTITFLYEYLQGVIERTWVVECPFRYIDYGLLYKGRPYINWIVEFTESMELD
jgi:hypothetical protein